MEKVRPWCGQPSDRGRLRNRTEQNSFEQINMMMMMMMNWCELHVQKSICSGLAVQLVVGLHTTNPQQSEQAEFGFCTTCGVVSLVLRRSHVDDTERLQHLTSLSPTGRQFLCKRGLILQNFQMTRSIVWQCVSSFTGWPKNRAAMFLYVLCTVIMHLHSLL